MTRLASHGLAGSALLLLAALCVGGVGGCGPSFQAVYEGELRFEHCYALDQTSAADEAKKDCWREWLRGYTYGQSEDRVEYGATRFSELSLDPTLPSEDVSDGGVRRRPRRPEATVAAPMPTNAFAPPPSTSAVDGREAADGKPDAGRAAQVAAAPGAECVAACEGRWNGCRGGCKDGACEACDRAYRSCMPPCFREDAGAAKGH